MANPLYQEQMNNNMQNQFNSFMKNPMQFLMKRKINIPEQYSNDPHGAVQHLLDTGELKQNEFNRLMNMAQKMGVKF